MIHVLKEIPPRLTQATRLSNGRAISRTGRLPPPSLIGWSQGANDVAAYLQQFGTQSVAGVVFVDSPVSIGPAEIEVNPEETKKFLGLLNIYVNHPVEYCEGMVESIFKKPPPELDLKKVIAQSRKTPVNTGLSMLITDMYTVDRRPVLAKIDKPVLVIASAESSLFDAQKKMAEAINGAQFVTVKDVGHGLFVDDPRSFDEALERLLALVN